MHLERPDLDAILVTRISHIDARGPAKATGDSGGLERSA